MVVAQLFEVTVSADGSELSSKRVSKLSRRYHLHKKQLRQSARMADGLPDAAAADGSNEEGKKREVFFLISISPSSIILRMTSSRTQGFLSVTLRAESMRVLKKTILQRVFGGNTKQS